MNDWADVPKLNFAMFPNKYCTTDMHPKKTGKIEITREFLKAMLERAKTGEMPILRVAMWEKTSQAGNNYDNFKLELAKSEASVTVDKNLNDETDDDFPF
tara:strand:- start:870 stop:1169 length:300 start_codon:yes stop_codon:yes gene_type:complete